MVKLFNKASLFIICGIFSPILSQSYLSPRPIKKLISEKNNFDVNKKDSIRLKNKFKIFFLEDLYLNNNLPNLENQNGLYTGKGFGSITSYYLEYDSKYFQLTAQPQLYQSIDYRINDLAEKPELFSYTNENVINDYSKRQQSQLKNIGFKIKNKFISLGFSNWNQWWGPGIHNSLVLSNNSKGFYYYFIKSNGKQNLNKNFNYKFNYIISKGMKNKLDNNFYLSAASIDIEYKNLSFGYSRHILSGGYDAIPWNINNSAVVLFSGQYMKYWDMIDDFYILANFPKSKLKLFFEFGFPNRFFSGKNPELYADHALATNFGLRKYGFFNNENIVVGFEYTRLLQGLYYNSISTPNWYDNYKYNYTTYKGRHWAAHSGPDSDDLLIYGGIIISKKSLIFGINYERHGVTFHFPPEVKLEFKILASINIKKLSIYLNFENEYLQHFGFVDNNRNVWDETFENGSVQRTNTILFSFEYSLY